MKMTIESYEEKVKQFEAKRKQINDEIAELAKKEAALLEDCKAAVAAGDVDTYIKLNRQKEDVSAALFVKRSFLDNMGKAATPEEAKEAWTSFVSGYDKEMKKALEDFEATKRNLLSKYKALAEKQAAALKIRDGLNESAGLPEKSFPMTFIPCLQGINALGQLKKGNIASFDPDLLYYMACREREAGTSLLLNPDSAEAKDTEAVFSVVVRHKAM